ncbi:hypothetical protein [Burkholderia ubonensis]|uniref:hypothetical protein n=1 Tax=Burkholderia ubonensis TaxID=101571 RepID=UPI000A893D1E|nr:hypothetical protein [Burkholderia ubonensis]
MQISRMPSKASDFQGGVIPEETTSPSTSIVQSITGRVPESAPENSMDRRIKLRGGNFPYMIGHAAIVEKRDELGSDIDFERYA